MSREDPHDLLAMVFARPREALTAAKAVLAAGRGPYESSIARQALGILHREFGDLEAAIRELRQSVRLARRSGSADREADVLATLGIALLHSGRTRAGLSALDSAAARADGTTRARVLFRRAGARWILGRHTDALDDLRDAVPALLAARDTVWAARALTLRGHVQLALGAVAPADADFRTAQDMLGTTPQEHDSAVAVQNRGVAAFRTGDLPAALDLLDEAERRFRALGTPMLDLVADRCAVLLAAGLARDALEQADGALRLLARLRGQATRRAELLLIAARAALQSADPATAIERAGEARRLFARQHRTWWSEHARLIVLQAEHARLLMPQAEQGTLPAPADGPEGRRLLREARRLAGRLAALGSPEVWQAHLLAGRVALVLGRPGVADEHLAAAADVRHKGPATGRVGGWLAEALRAEAAGEPRRLLRACRAGLALIEEHRLTFGSSELRALATAQGAELVTLAQRHLLRTGRPRRLLAWTERWRATDLAVPAVCPPEDDRLIAQLTALRQAEHLLGQARQDGAASAATLERDRSRLESRVRATTLRSRGGHPGGERDADRTDRLLAALGESRLVELVVVDGTLHVLLCGGGTVRRHTVGPMERAAAEVEFARSRLRRLAYEGRPDQRELHALGARLEEALLGPVAGRLGDAPLVVVPPSTLHTTPWALLPSLRRRPFTVAPSAGAWLRARAARRPPDGRIVLVRGPGVAHADGEIRQIAHLHGGPAPESAIPTLRPGVSTPRSGVPASDLDVPVSGPGDAVSDLDAVSGPGVPFSELGDAVSGPGVPATGAGAPPYGEVTVLAEGQATAPAVLAAIDGSPLAHLAAHGTFRADSPLFSSLHLDDGPLTGYDLERLRRAPHHLVLSSCDSGQMAAVGADELLGLATALLRLGTAAIVASVVPVNDETAVPVMVGLHDGLRRGLGLAEALCRARGDDVSFIAIGAG
ncbi:CHAT domain-containing protein [Nonomuraea phyllanthi]|uniref:CHAT domain-containing protein n=1 Tax=Nonomuraea phyllanthi TaxID=2219224 RepID=UPI00129354BD|nr:CHAT domain-containing tetratricopeptide repeat protein [Nonomuraea phyllanthi]QFY08988.1 CHAT domain-containing protein [Nonomuraea phyllanthi]